MNYSKTCFGRPIIR